MHDPKAYMASLFAQEWDKFHYPHEDLPDESMYMGATDFWEEMEKITDSEVKSHVFKYQKSLKESTLHFRKLRFDAEEKFHRENMEREARPQATIASASASQSKDKGKAVIETPGNAHSSQEMEVLQRGEEFKQGLAKLSAHLQIHVEEAET